MGGSVVFATEEGDNSSDSSPPGQEEVPPPEPIDFDCAFPIVEGSADEMFKYEIYTTPAAKEFAGVYDINVVSPPGWEATVWVGRGDTQQRAGAVNYGGRKSSEHHLTVAVKPLQGKIPEPGEYAIILEMEWGPYKGSYYLTAIVTANYEFDMYTDTGRLNTETRGSEEKHIFILLENTGTAAIDNIILSSTKPEGWNITFDPAKIDSLEPGLKQQVDVVVKPPKRTIAYDYTSILRAESENGSDTLELRITVLAPRTMAGAGIGISAGVIVGLIFLFRRLSMRYTSGANH